MAANVNLWILMLVVVPGVQGYYNCNKQSMECKNGGTCSAATNTCSCPDEYQGDDCSVERALINGAGCTQATCADGLCLSGAICACPPDRYGTRCQLERLSVVCEVDRMVILANPFPDFDGVFYIMGKGNQNACVLKPVPADKTGTKIPSDAEGLYLELNHDDPVCGDAVAKVEGASQNVIYVREIETAYMVNGATYMVDRFDYYCRYLPLTQLVSGSGVYVNIDRATTTPPPPPPTTTGCNRSGLSLGLMLMCLFGAFKNN